MRGAAVFLSLLLCVQSETEDVKAARGHSSSRQTNITTDIWAELRELRDMVIELQVELRYSQSKVAALEQENAGDSNTLFNHFEFCSSTREHQPSFTFSALMFFLIADLNVFTALKARMSTSENQDEELKRENTERPKVVFSLGLSSAGLGPFNTEVTIKFSKVFYNFGEAYNPFSGFFIAPVRGAYYFRFTMWECRAAYTMAVSLYHNDKMVMLNVAGSDDKCVNVSNALMLQLEKGDVVHMTLLPGYGLYDNNNNLVTFSGFLLFPL
uniref:C1q domain-containing protein n=1 Tax=Stegastes partitus TaxID=144197 RepID=A0A3B5B4S2_9TELE